MNLSFRILHIWTRSPNVFGEEKICSLPVSSLLAQCQGLQQTSPCPLSPHSTPTLSISSSVTSGHLRTCAHTTCGACTPLLPNRSLPWGSLQQGPVSLPPASAACTSPSSSRSWSRLRTEVARARRSQVPWLSPPSWGCRRHRRFTRLVLLDLNMNMTWGGGAATWPPSLHHPPALAPSLSLSSRVSRTVATPPLPREMSSSGRRTHTLTFPPH